MKRSPEARARMSAAQKASWADPEKRTRKLAAQKARWEKPAERAKNSTAQIGKTLSPETRAKISAALTGIKRSRETCARMSASQKSRGIEVPKWVPADLIGDYAEAAKLYGEEQAASIVRRMKREMAEAPR